MRGQEDFDSFTTSYTIVDPDGEVLLTVGRIGALRDIPPYRYLWLDFTFRDFDNDGVPEIFVEGQAFRYDDIEGFFLPQTVFRFIDGEFRQITLPSELLNPGFGFPMLTDSQGRTIVFRSNAYYRLIIQDNTFDTEPILRRGRVDGEESIINYQTGDTVQLGEAIWTYWPNQWHTLRVDDYDGSWYLVFLQHLPTMPHEPVTPIVPFIWLEFESTPSGFTGGSYWIE